jgi:hypothetical protein
MQPQQVEMTRFDLRRPRREPIGLAAARLDADLRHRHPQIVDPVRRPEINTGSRQVVALPRSAKQSSRMATNKSAEKRVLCPVGTPRYVALALAAVVRDIPRWTPRANPRRDDAGDGLAAAQRARVPAWRQASFSAMFPQEFKRFQ